MKHVKGQQEKYEELTLLIWPW